MYLAGISPIGEAGTPVTSMHGPGAATSSSSSTQEPGIQAVETPPQAPPKRSIFWAYFALTKPRVIELLLWATVPTMVLAQRGVPNLWLVLATVLGGFFAAGSAHAINCYLDRDIDVVMRRTRRRPLATGEVTPQQAMIFGVSLGVFAMVWLALLVNPLSAALAGSAILFYVFVYTIGLKRRTPQNIVWGGAAGCVPVLVGWAAVTNTVSWAAVVLFGVIFFWTPPHYWPLSMRYAEEYASVDVPMLGAVAHPKAVASQMIRYSWAMVACSLLLTWVAPMGLIYTVVAAVTGAWFLLECYLLQRRAASGVEDVRAMRVFHASITYLTLLFVAVAVDPFIPIPLY